MLRGDNFYISNEAAAAAKERRESERVRTREHMRWKFRFKMNIFHVCEMILD
jgi:hypothetical protein